MSLWRWEGSRALRRTGRWGIGVALLILCPGAAQGYEHRKSTPSFGFQFGYGRLVAGEDYFVQDFPTGDGRVVDARLDLSETNPTWGPSGHVEVRFVLDRSHAIGFGFDDLRYRRGSGYTDEQKGSVPRWAKFTTFHADYYLYFNRRSRISYYLAPFLGLQQRELRYRGSEIQVTEYKLLYGSGVGVEYFLRRSVSVDCTGRVFALRGGTGTNVVVQPALGVHFYVF